MSDLHGDVAAAEASGSPAIAVALRYDGYGQTLATYAGTGAVAMDAKYQGRLDLSATADPLYDMSARMYAPGLGAFTSLDSVTGSAQNPLSMNRFLYAEANPTSFIDPTGHMRPPDEYVSQPDPPKPRGKVARGGSLGATAAGASVPNDPPEWEPDPDGWGSMTEDERHDYAQRHIDDLLDWNGWNNDDKTRVAYLIAWYYNDAQGYDPSSMASWVNLPDPWTALDDTQLHKLWKTGGWAGMSVVNHMQSPDWASAIGLGVGVGQIKRNGPAFGGSLAAREAEQAAATNAEIAGDLVRAAKGGMAPVLKGRMGEALSENYFVEVRGWTLRGRQISIRAGGVNMKADVVLETPDGVLVAVESKYGFFTALSENQQIAVPAISAEGGTFFGGNAAEAGLSGPINDIIVQRWLPELSNLP